MRTAATPTDITSGAFQPNSARHSPRASSLGAARLGLLICVFSTTLASRVSAQWTAISLDPGFGEGSRAVGIFGSRQVGWVIMDGSNGHGRHGYRWNSTPDSWVDLNPAHADGGSRVYSADGAQSVGLIFSTGEHRAALWSGSNDTYISLHPADAAWSAAYGVHYGQQVGRVVTDRGWRAGLWQGSADWTDLTPAAATAAEALAVHNGQQVGWVWIENVQHASVWTGDADSWLSLRPGSAEMSVASAVHNGTQVGHAYFDNMTVMHAGMWTGSAESWIDLNPAGAAASTALGVHGDTQVGAARFDGRDRAGLWTGDAESWIDLHALLPEYYKVSTAAGVWTEPGLIHVTGWAYNQNTGQDEAMLWRLAVPAPGSAALAPLALAALTRRRHRARV